MRFLPSLTVLILILALAACGGGSGFDGPDPIDNDQDIVATDPQPFETDVAETRQIHIDLALDLDTTVPFANSLFVTSPAGALAGSWTYDGAARRLTFTADEHLVLGAEHTVRIEPGLRFAEGTTKNDAFAFVFDVRTPVFSGAQRLETRDETIPGRHFEMNAKGDGMSVTVFTLPGGERQFDARRRLRDGTFEPPFTILTADNVQGSTMAIDADGNAAFVWYTNSGTRNVGLRYYDAQNDAWRGTRWVDENPDTLADAASALFDGLGNVFVSWRNRSTDTDLWRAAVRRYNANGTMEATEYSGAYDALLIVRLAVNQRGDAAASWAAFDTGERSSTFAMAYERGNDQWSAVAPLEDITDSPSYAIGMQMSEDGYAGALISASDDPTVDSEHVRLALFTPSDQPNPGWQQGFPLQTDRGYINDYSLHVTQAGTFVAAFTYVVDNAIDEGEVRAVRYTPGIGIHSEARFSERLQPGIYDGDFYASLAPSGDLLVAWTVDVEGQQEEIRFGLQHNDGTVIGNRLVKRLSDPDHTVGQFICGAAPDGGGLLLWEEPDLAAGAVGEVLYALRVDRDGGFGSAFPLTAEPDTDAAGTRIRYDEMGRGIVHWLERTLSDAVTSAWYRDLR